MIGQSSSRGSKYRESTPLVRRAAENMRTLVRSPIERMSSSSCFSRFPLEVFLAVFISTSVVLPIAETTTAILVPVLASLTTAATALESRSGSARLEPPNLTTIFLQDFSVFICHPSAPRTLLKSFVLGSVIGVIKVVLEARETCRKFFHVLVRIHECSLESANVFRA
jgi:hypothetical protein